MKIQSAARRRSRRLYVLELLGNICSVVLIRSDDIWQDLSQCCLLSQKYHPGLPGYCVTPSNYGLYPRRILNSYSSATLDVCGQSKCSFPITSSPDLWTRLTVRVHETRPPFCTVVYFMYILMDPDQKLKSLPPTYTVSDKYEICRG
jgi:hypothetical protein